MQKLTLSEIKTIKGLSQKKNRDKSGLFVVEGEKMVSEAQAAGFEVVMLFRKEEIGEEQMRRISFLDSPSRNSESSKFMLCI